MHKLVALILFSIIVISTSFSYSASLVSAGRVILETTPLPKAASRVYAKISGIIEPVRIKFPESQGVDAVKGAIREGVTATAAASSGARDQYNLTVNTNVQEPTIRIMNIGPNYKDGIELESGDYELFIEKTGYRSKRFWFTLEDESNQNNEVVLDVNLKSLGLPNCTDNINIENYGGAWDDVGGNIVQIEAVFEDVNINDLYLSFAKETKDSNFLEVIDTIVYPNYVEFRMAQPTALSATDIRENKVVEIDADRFVMNRVIFEQEQSNVRYVLQHFMPPGVYISDISEEHYCENITF